MISIQQQGRRFYLTGNTYPHRDAIRSLGAHWDAGSRSWWTAKKDDAEVLISRLNGKDRAAEAAEREAGIDTGAAVLIGRCEYEGRKYYLLAQGSSRQSGKPYAKLAFRDGSKVFWAKEPEKVKVLKHYREPCSLDGLRHYAERAKSYGTDECRCRCHHEHNAGAPGTTLYDGCDRCGCEV